MESAGNPDPHLERITVVLARTIYARNVGLTARAMANMGAGRLVLVAPQCEIDEQARQGAAGAQAALRSLVVYNSWDDLYQSEGAGIRFALSRREGRMRPASRLDQCLGSLKTLSAARILKPEVPLYLIFGPEDDGLNSDDLKYAHHICELPTYGDFKSFNLSHAVLLTLYIVRNFLESEGSSHRADMSRLAGLITSEDLPPVQIPDSEMGAKGASASLKRAPVYHPEKTIQTWLETLGFDLSSKRVNAAKILNRILLENTPTEDELRVLESILQQNIRKLRENSQPARGALES